MLCVSHSTLTHTHSHNALFSSSTVIWYFHYICTNVCTSTMLWINKYVHIHIKCVREKRRHTHTLKHTAFFDLSKFFLLSFQTSFSLLVGIFFFSFHFYYSGRYKSNTSTPMCQACLDNWLREGWVNTYNILYKRIFFRSTHSM